MELTWQIEIFIPMRENYLPKEKTGH